MKKSILSFLILFCLLFAAVQFLCVPITNAGSVDTMLWGGYKDEVKAQSGLGNTDPRSMVGAIIKVFLGFLGVIAVLIVLYGGFMWMTAAGNDDRIGKAKQIIGAGVVGLAIILMAFGIAQFVMENLYSATGASG